jgi:outer membrane protein
MLAIKPAFRLGLATALLAAAGHVTAADLLGSYELARKTDPGILAASEGLAAGREKAEQGNALLRPQVSMSGGLSNMIDKSSTSLPPVFNDLIKPKSSGNLYQVSVRLTQPLYDAKAVAEKQQMHQQSSLAEVVFRNAQQELLQRVAQVYFSVLLAEESVRVTQAERAAVRMQLERTQARFEAGRDKITDVQQAQARHDSVVAREISAQSELALRQAQYRELTGAPAAGLADLRPGFTPAAPQPDSLSLWQDKALAGNLMIQMRQGDLAIATAEVDKHRLNARPSVDLVASYSHRGHTGDLSATIAPDSSHSTMLGVQVSIPLYTGGRINSRLRETEAKKRQAEQDLNAARRDARLQVQDAYLAMKTGVAQLDALNQALVSAQTSLQAVTLGRDVGTRTTVDVLDAQQRLSNTQIDLARARFDYLLGRVKLAAAAGELQEEDLRGLNGFLGK